MKGIRTVAALYDIHGNRTALKAVLEEVAELDVDMVVLGGDIAWGPHPSETIDIVRRSDTTIGISGNADRELVGRHGMADGLDEEVATVNAWCADQLSSAQLAWLADLPFSRSLGIAGVQTLFCHGTPRSDEEIVTSATPDDRLQEACAGVVERVVVCGHTHMQFDRRCGDRRIVNAGSVGLSYEDTAGAYWALIGRDIELRRTPFDITETVAGFRSSGCPHVEEIFVNNLLDPPGREVTTAHFERVAESRRR